MSNEQKIIGAVDALADIMAGFEERLVSLETKAVAPVTPEMRASALVRSMEPKRWAPAEGTQAYAILEAIVLKGGTWSPDRALDVLRGTDLEPRSDRGAMVTSGVLGKLVEHGYLRRLDRGRYVLRSNA